MQPESVRRKDAAALQLLTDPVVIVDQGWIVVDANPAARNAFGVAARTLFWTSIASVSAELEKLIRTVIRAAGAREFQHPISGVWFAVDVHDAPDGARVLHFRDVTRMREAELTARDARAKLESEIALRRDAEHRAELNNEFTQALLENVEAGIVACDETGHLRLFNRSTRQFHGLPEAPIPADEWASHYDLYYPDGVTPLRKEDIPLYRAFCGEIVRNAEMVIAPRNGPRRNLLASGRAFFARDGRKLGAVVAMHDVTHRKIANKRVRNALREFRSLFKDAPIAYHEIDRAGCIRRVNRTECLLFGCTREEMLGRPVWEFVPEGQREASRTAVKEKLAGIRPLRPFEREYRAASGALITAEVHENLIKDSSGAILGIRTALLDITDRKRTEEQARVALRERTAREQAEADSAEIKSILERIGDAYIAFDTEWRYTYVNQRGAELARKPAEELIGRCVWDEFPEAVQTAFFTELHRSLRDQISIQFENYFAPLGKWFDNTVYPSPHGVSVFYRDVTERKRAEHSLEKKTVDLARKNAELEAFAYMASHDLQEPLRAVTAFTELLARKHGTQLGPEAQEFIRHILSGTVRMRELIDDLLLLCRVGDTDPARLRDIDLREVLNVVRRNLAGPIRDTGATIELADLPSVKGIETHLTQLLQNLIANSIRYRGDRAPSISITPERGTREWKFAVRDNGIGFDPRHAQNIFKPFTRLGPPGSGTGIGLAICKKIVESRGGRIWAESVPGAGSAFHFTIPDDIGAPE
jgi:PAS domain S-box-containing protein